MSNCSENYANACFDFNTAGSSINTIVTANNYIYAGLSSGVMWRCELNKADSCITLNKAASSINTLAIGNGYLYAGLSSGTMWR
jgi:hypothetical protein